MKRVKNVLESEYGKWFKEKNYLCNCILNHFSNETYLNVLFDKPEYKKNIEYLKKNGIEISRSIDNFYKEYNGVSLFSHSLVIYGYINNLEMGYTPLNAESMNLRIRARNKQWNDEYISFGEYSRFNFCLKRKDKSGTVYIINRFDNQLIRTFSDFDELLEYAIDKLIKLYDINGIRKNIDKSSKSSLDNRSTEEIF